MPDKWQDFMRWTPSELRENSTWTSSEARENEKSRGIYSTPTTFSI